MAALATDDIGAQEALAAAHDERGRVHQAQGNLSAALESYKAAHAIRERLAKTATRQRGMAARSRGVV